MPCDEMRGECERKFDDLEKRVGEAGSGVGNAKLDIVRLETKVDSLIKSMNSLTKALWGICGTTVATLFGFFVWFVQNR